MLPFVSVGRLLKYIDERKNKNRKAHELFIDLREIRPFVNLQFEDDKKWVARRILQIELDFHH